MGTRNLTMVVKDGKYKVAQYGQWDGYLECSGVRILQFLKKVDMKKFSEYVDNVKFLTEEEVNALNKTEWQRENPYLSRDCGCDILDYVMSEEGNIGLTDESEFAKESLSCEYAYLIDLDTNELEIYKGFNKSKENESPRFVAKEVDNYGYCGVSVLGKFDINKLPTEKEFLALEPEEDE